MTVDITPGIYRNTNTGAEFELEVDGDEVVIRDVHGATDLEIRKHRIEFYINTQAAIPDDQTPTYELVKATETETESDTADTAADAA